MEEAGAAPPDSAAKPKSPPPAMKAPPCTLPLPYPKTTLYVGDLHPDLTEMEFSDAFRGMGTTGFPRICRDFAYNSLGYGYVNFVSHAEAAKALACLNHKKLKGKPMRIMWSHKDPLQRKTGVGNLFVKNLDPSITGARLQGIFCKYGTILSCKVAEENGKSKGFGFVQFDSEDSAMDAVDSLHDSMLEGRKLYVSKFLKKSQRNVSEDKDNFTNLYVRNLSQDLTEDDLREKFSSFGRVCSAVIMRDSMGKSKGFGFVSFQLPEEAKKAVDDLNGAIFGSKALFVGRAQKKSERQEILKREHQQNVSCPVRKSNASNLYVKNLDASVNDHDLHEYFSVCGQVISAKVMCDDQGMSKGFGFVSFSGPEGAKKALAILNGSYYRGRFIYVALAQRKEDRLRFLKTYHAYNPSSWGIPSYQLCHPSYMFTAYPPSSNLPYTSSYEPSAFQHYGSHVGGLYPSSNQPIVYPYVPVQQSQSGNLKGHSQYQILSTAYTSSHAPSHNLNSRRPAFQKFISRRQWNSQNGPARSSSKGPTTAQRPTATLSSASRLKNYREILYPLVENIQPDVAGKITGMLLDTKQSDITKLINSPNTLAVEVGKAVEVLRDTNAWTSEGTVKSARCLNY